MTRMDSEKGAVLLTTLLVMAIMAALAVAMLDQTRFAVKRASHVQAYAQADWYMLGAEDFASQHLERLIQNSETEQLNRALSKPSSVAFPIEGGSINLSIRDGGHCVSLGSLTQSPGRRLFRDLLIQIGWVDSEAARMTSVAVDWQDSDNQPLPDGAEDFTYLGKDPAYRTANTSFLSVSELRLLDGMDEDQFQNLRPYVCARDEDASSKININTLTKDQAPLLAAILGGSDGLKLAEQLIVDRPSAGYSSLNDILTSSLISGRDNSVANFDELGFMPTSIWVEARVQIFEAERLAAFEFSIENGQVSRLYRGFGEEAFRPILKANPQ